MTIFEVITKLQKNVRLTEIQWWHIEAEHPELSGQVSRMIDTLETPDFVCYCREDDNYHYYKFFQETPVSSKHLLVIVKHLNGDGFVITAFFVRSVKKDEKEVIYGQENFNQL